MPALLILAMLLLCGCFLQESAPVLLKGEEFHGATDKSGEGYHLFREYVEGASTSPLKSSSKVLVGEVSQEPAVSTCDFAMPLQGTVVPAHATGRNKVYRTACDSGTAILDNKGVGEISSASSGRVLYVGRNLESYGNLVIVEHDKYTVTMYYHLGDIKVKIGDTVKSGDLLATVLGENPHESKNRKDANFFCFSIRKNGKLVDPVKYIEACKAD